MIVFFLLLVIAAMALGIVGVAGAGLHAGGDERAPGRLGWSTALGH